MKRAQGGGIAVLYAAVASACLFIALGVRQGVDGDLQRLVASVGSDVFTIASSGEAFEDEVLTTLTNLPTIEMAGGATGINQFYSPAASNFLFVAGVSEDYFRLRNLKIVSGHGFEPPNAGLVAVIGAAVARELFEGEPPAGQSLTFRGQAIEVVGVLGDYPAERGSGSTWGFSLELDNPDNLVFLPVSQYRRIAVLPIPGAEGEGALRLIWARAAPGMLREATEQAGAALASMQGVQIRPLSSRFSGLYDSRRKVADTMTLIAIMILAISVANATSILARSVLDRCREIGTRRALGATRTQIAWMILREIAVLVLVGGTLGCIVGILVYPFLEAGLGVSVEFGPHHLLYVGVLLGAGLASGILPAGLAAFMEPAAAIRQRGLTSKQFASLSLSRIMSVVAIAAGVAVVTLVAISGTANVDYLKARWMSPPDDVVRVRAGIGGFRQPAALDFGDFEALSSLESVEASVWMASEDRVWVESDAHAARAILAEATEGIDGVGVGLVAEGGHLSPESFIGQEAVAVLGHELARTLFPDAYAIGQEIVVRGLPFQIVGVFAPRPGLPLYDFPDVNQLLLVPRGALALEPGSGSVWMWFAPPSEVGVDELAAAVETTIANRHPGRGDPEIVELYAEMMELIDMQLGISKAYLLLGGVGLLLAATGTASMLWLSVRVRAKEIGLRVAIGARRHSIFALFLGEGAIVAVLGGGLGWVIAVIGAQVIYRSSPSATGEGWWLLAALGVAGIVSLSASIIPAARAMDVGPANLLTRGDG